MMPTTFRASAFNLAASGCAPCANNGAVEIAKTATISSPFKWRVRMGKLTDAEPGPQSAVPGLGPDLDVARRHRRMAFRTIPQGRQTTRRYSLVGEGGYMGR